jgi:hypothetical protein
MVKTLVYVLELVVFASIALALSMQCTLIEPPYYSAPGRSTRVFAQLA